MQGYRPISNADLHVFLNLHKYHHTFVDLENQFERLQIKYNIKKILDQ